MVSPVILRGCPRCSGALDLYDRFPRCVMCGWADYGNNSGVATTHIREDSASYRGSRQRFSLDSELVILKNGGWSAMRIQCPYDHGSMNYYGLDSSDGQILHVFICGNRHRVRIWRDDDTNLLWR